MSFQLIVGFGFVFDGGFPTTIGVEAGLASGGLVLAAITLAEGFGVGRAVVGAADGVVAVLVTGGTVSDPKEIVPLCQTPARFSLLIANSITDRFGLAGADGSVMDFPLMLN